MVPVPEAEQLVRNVNKLELHPLQGRPYATCLIICILSPQLNSEWLTRLHSSTRTISATDCTDGSGGGSLQALFLLHQINGYSSGHLMVAVEAKAPVLKAPAGLLNICMYACHMYASKLYVRTEASMAHIQTSQSLNSALQKRTFHPCNEFRGQCQYVRRVNCRITADDVSHWRHNFIQATPGFFPFCVLRACQKR